MPESDDELELLRAADPVDRESLPSPDNPKAQALFERITMSDTDSIQTTPPADTKDRRPWMWAAAVAAAVLVLVGGARVLDATRDAPRDDPQNTPGTAQEPISPGGPMMASCVDVYDLETLARREVALDGTVQAVDGDEVTFRVNEWYRGGDSAEITLQGAGGLSGMTSAGGPGSLEPGTRLLVAGDGGFAWACGFTQPYDAAVAEDWKRVFAG